MSASATPEPDSLHASGTSIADRYTVRETLGRGGMAAVYRVFDGAVQRELALKQLFVQESAAQRATFEALFEREYHTLKQLSHPSMIAVYEYGLPAVGGAYYTMELLDGGDLRERAPVPWADLCRLMFDICSSLALLHSRRLVHRDISPRNIRCTTLGTAKLIDFGALSAMGPGGGPLVGTPAFAAPEMVQRSTIDARTDLFSLGTTFYYALTRRLAFAARTFPEALKAWDTKPLPPSSFVPEIPAALDELVMSLLHVEPALRPQSAFEVMQRLAAIAELPRSEPEGVSRAYLSTPTLVGRDEVLDDLRKLLGRSLERRGGGVLVRGAAGLGRSRVLDAMALEAKMLGVTVLRGAPNGAQQPFSTAISLAEYALEALPPSIVDPAFEISCGVKPSRDPSERVGRCMVEFGPEHPPSERQRRLGDFLLGVATAQPLLLAVDDVHLIDEPSAAVLSELIERAHRKQLLIAATALADTDGVRAIATLARRTGKIELLPLERDQVHTMLASMFGDVSNLTLLANEIYDVTRGNPRQIIDVAQHMFDNGVIRYTAGVWALPHTLSDSDMPRSAEAAIAARIASLSPIARALGEAHALAFQETLTRRDYYALRPDIASRAVDEAVAELERHQALNGDGNTFSLASRIWGAAFRAGLDDAASIQHHRALAELYRVQSPLAMIHHLFCGGLDESALDTLLQHLRGLQNDLSVRDVIVMRASQLRPSYLYALRAAERLGRPERQKHDLRRWLVTLSVISDSECYFEGAPQWLERLKLDSGWSDWEADPDRSDPGQRLSRALQAAHQRYLQTPEAQQVYRFDEAIRYLAEFVGISMAIGARVHDFALMRGLPALLEPFAPLSRLVHAVWQNAIAGSESTRCRYRDAHARWKEVHASLADVTPEEFKSAEVIRNAVAFGVGFYEAFLGLPTAEAWAELLDSDPLQHLSALSMRKIVRLGQGNWHAADRIRREIEVLTLQARAPQMFNSLLSIELNAYAAGRDLTGVREMLAKLRPLAAQYPGWQGDLHLAEARFEFLRGDLAMAKRNFERCLEVVGDPSDAATNPPAWIGAQAGLVEVLLAADQATEALARARSAFATMHALEMDADDITRVLALAEARCDEIPSATTRLDELIAEQAARGVTGLRLGLSYEARAQVAIWAGDEQAFATYALQTAREYRHGAGSPLGTRYERLMSQAQRRGFGQSFMLGVLQNAENEDSAYSTAIVAQALLAADNVEELARRALRLICSLRRVGDGYLYMVRDDKVTLAATYGGVDASDALLDQVRDYVRWALREDNLETVVDSAEVTAQAPPATVAQAGGRAYRLLPLRAGRGDATRVVAVAAVADTLEPVSVAATSRVLEAIATKLDVAYGTGDAESVNRVT